MSLEHGTYLITVKDNIIVIKLSGPFNDFGAIALLSEVKKTIKGFNHNNFSILDNFLELEGATPEAMYEAMYEANEFNKWLINQNLVAKAIVIRSIALKELDKKLIPSQENLNIKFFENEEEAMHWLKTQN
mgnify:CR=1 FL=1